MDRSPDTDIDFFKFIARIWLRDTAAPQVFIRRSIHLIKDFLYINKDKKEVISNRKNLNLRS